MPYKLILLSIIICNSCMAQKVENKGYSTLLKGLLSHSVKELSVDEAQALNTPVYLDARSLAEYEVSHIKEALFVGYDKPNFSLLDHVSKDKTLIVYCSVGYRSEKIAEKLLEKGFKDVYNLYGGIFEWKNQGYPVYKDSKLTNKVHAYNKIWGLWLKSGEKVYR